MCKCSEASLPMETPSKEVTTIAEEFSVPPAATHPSHSFNLEVWHVSLLVKILTHDILLTCSCNIILYLIHHHLREYGFMFADHEDSSLHAEYFTSVSIKYINDLFVAPLIIVAIA